MSNKSYMRAARILVVITCTAVAGIVVGNPTDSGDCASQCNLAHGYCTPEEQCKCFTGWQGSNCNQCTVSAECVHGTCQTADQCLCEEGWTGENCDIALDYCDKNQPCLNDGICVSRGIGGYECVCRQGFDGNDCQFKKIDTNAPENFSHLCQNGGTCIFGNQNIGCERCVCPKGYGGKHCEAFLSMCNTMPCANGGTCLNTNGDFRCDCTPGYTGKDCTQDVDECSKLGESACANGGLCVNKKGSYDCKCLSGFEGVRCEMPTRRLPPRHHQTTTSRGLSTEFRNPVHRADNSGRFLDSPSSRNLANGGRLPAAAASENRYVTKVKVTHIVEQVIDRGSAADSKSVYDSSVSAIQAVTFAFLGVALALFIGIVAFLWFYCARRRRHQSPTAGRIESPDVEIDPRPSRVSSVCLEQHSNRGSFVPSLNQQQKARASFDRQQHHYRDNSSSAPIRAARPGSAVRTFSTLSSDQPRTDGLYVSLPQESNSDCNLCEDMNETRSFLTSGQPKY